MMTAVVIGAGPAGSAAALLLARRGVSVDLLEQHSFPRDKVCGECLSALGRSVLDRAGLTAALSELQPADLQRTIIHPAVGPSVDASLPLPMWGLTRHALDQAMLSAAIDAGVAVHQPARCERVDSGPRPTVYWRDLQTNAVRHTTADWVIVADGKGGLPTPPPPPTGDLGVKAHFAGVDGPRDAIELFAGPGCYGGLAAVEGDRWNAAFSIPAAAIKRANGDLAVAFESVVQHNPTLARRLRPARRLGRFLAAPLPRFAVRSSWPQGVVFVGNAAAALEPIGGEGMGLALRSAELAAGAIVAGPAAVAALPDAYRSLWRRRRLACRSVARVVSSPTWADAAADLLHGEGRLITAAMRWMGKAAGAA